MTSVDVVRERLGAVVASIETLGPILELDRRWRSSEPLDLGGARALRAEIQEVLDRPHCAYDERALALYRVLVVIPARERRAVRDLIGEDERRALIPYGIRAPWLALEERSAERLRSGLVLKALELPDEDDYRDVMISLAPARVVAGELDVDGADAFDEAATFAGESVGATFRVFGRRETGLGAFGWQRVTTGHGERFHLVWV